MLPLPDVGTPPLPDAIGLDAHLLDTILTVSDDQIYVQDEAGRFLYVCVIGAAMLGLTRDAMLGRTAQELGMDAKLRTTFDRERGRVLETLQPSHATLSLTTPDGLHDYSYTFALLCRKEDAPPVDGQRMVVCMARDVTELNRAQQEVGTLLAQMRDANSLLEEANSKLHEMAMRDGLTGLLNHRAFLERLQEEHARAVRHHLPLSLLLLDIDHFKGYNDAHGHPAGDGALCHVSECLQSLTRDTDTVARYGGEEFFVVLPQTDLDGALVMGERIRAGIQTSDTAPHPLTVSIGACAMGDGLNSPQSLIACADKALYRAKAAGRNRVRK